MTGNLDELTFLEYPLGIKVFACFREEKKNKREFENSRIKLARRKINRK